MKAEELYESLKESELMNLRFSGLHKVGDFDINLDRANVIGNIMQEWLEGWLKKNNIEYSPNENTQMPPDVFLNPDDKTKDLLEVKAFTGSPNFDVAAFRSFINLVIDKPWKLHSKHLLIKYKSEGGVVTIEKFWMKNLWEICSTSGVWPVKVQYKNKVIVNIRPSTWYSENSEYPSFESLEDFLAALEETIYRYHDTRSTIAEHWSEQVCKAYKAYYGKTLNIPRWNDIKSKYIKEDSEG